MSRFRAAAVACILLLLVPTVPAVLATHAREEGPPASTYGWIGGASVNLLLNAPPQEIDLEGNVVNENPGGGKQRLQSEGTFDCATGEPSVGPGSARYTLDVVPLTILANSPVGIGADDHALADQVSGEDTPPSNVTYDATLFLGYGEEEPVTLYPGSLTFFAYVLCGSAPATVLPEAAPNQYPGLVGYHDEMLWGQVDGGNNRFAPEWVFGYRGPRPDQAGVLLPGDLTTPGWYLASPPPAWTANLNLQTNVFRFAVNPVLTSEFPGYVGSRFSLEERRCLLDSADAPEDGALFGNCDSGGIRAGPFVGPMNFFPAEPAPATPDAPAPLLEDVEVYRAPDHGLLGTSLVEPAYMEAVAAERAVNDGTGLSGGTSAIALEPNAPGDDSTRSVGNGWSMYFDVQRYTSVPRAYSGRDPLFDAGLVTAPQAYPGFTLFQAILGLARDRNEDDVITRSSAEEWFPLDDSLVRTSDHREIADIADVGFAAPGGNDLVTGEQVLRVDYCTQEVTEHAAGSVVPVSHENVFECNDRGDWSNGWGTFYGFDSTDGGGFYESQVQHFTAGGSLDSEWRSTVQARVKWPTATQWAAAGLSPPQGVSITAGSVFILTDVDVYGPTLG